MKTSRSGAIAIGIAGLLFLLYPVVRPWPDESRPSAGLAESLASDAWMVSHLLAVGGFILIPFALQAIRRQVGDGAGSRPSAAAVLTGWIGVGLTLPYYGAEVFGGHAIAAIAIERSDPSLLTAMDALRYQPAAITLFGLGLVLLAVSGVLVVVALSQSSRRAGWLATPFAFGLVLFLPQFLADAALRIAHGVLLALGCFLVAAILAWPAERSGER